LPPAAMLLGPGLVTGPLGDSAVFVLEGSRIREGYMPYRDLWDQKPPGVYLINALGQMALPWVNAWLISWLLTLASTAAAVLLIDLLLRRRLSSSASWGWSLVSCVGVACYPIALGGGLTESFALLPLVAALLAIAAWPRTWLTAIAIGCALSCACILSCSPCLRRESWLPRPHGTAADGQRSLDEPQPSLPAGCQSRLLSRVGFWREAPVAMLWTRSSRTTTSPIARRGPSSGRSCPWWCCCLAAWRSLLALQC